MASSPLSFGPCPFFYTFLIRVLTAVGLREEKKDLGIRPWVWCLVVAHSFSSVAHHCNKDNPGTSLSCIWAIFRVYSFSSCSFHGLLLRKAAKFSVGFGTLLLHFLYLCTYHNLQWQCTSPSLPEWWIPVILFFFFVRMLIIVTARFQRDIWGD